MPVSYTLRPPSHDLSYLPNGWMHLADIWKTYSGSDRRHCVACLFTTKDGNLRIQQEGKEWIPHNLTTTPYPIEFLL